MSIEINETKQIYIYIYIHPQKKKKKSMAIVVEICQTILDNAKNNPKNKILKFWKAKKYKDLEDFKLRSYWNKKE